MALYSVEMFLIYF